MMSFKQNNNETISSSVKAAPFYLIAWRWHFYAGLFVIPFFLVLSITGLMMLLLNSMQARYGEPVYVVPLEEMTTPVAHTESASSVFPNADVIQYMPPPEANRAALLQMQTQAGSITFVAINPYTNEVVNAINKDSTWFYIANDIHGTLLIGDWGDRLIEIAASLGFIMIVTGMYLWWPRTRLTKVRSGVRSRWKVFHKTVGFFISLPLIFFLISGLSWSGIWGEKLLQPWNTFPAEKWGNIPLSDETHAKMNHGASKEVPWGLEKTAMPQSGSDIGISGLPKGIDVNLTAIVDYAKAIGFGAKFRINLPQSDSAVYTISADSMDGDTNSPSEDRTLHIDRHTGKVLGEVTFADYSLMAQSMAVGIALHQGDMGWWNFLLNTLFCVAVIFLCISGIIMCWIRRPEGKQLQAPPLPVESPLWKSAAIIVLMLSIIFPLAGVAILTVLVVDILLKKYPPAFMISNAK